MKRVILGVLDRYRYSLVTPDDLFFEIEGTLLKAFLRMTTKPFCKNGDKNDEELAVSMLRENDSTQEEPCLIPME